MSVKRSAMSVRLTKADWLSVVRELNSRKTSIGVEIAMIISEGLRDPRYIHDDTLSFIFRGADAVGEVEKTCRTLRIRPL